MNNSLIIAISIKTYNRHEVLKKCIQSITEFCSVQFRLYISDDSDVMPPDIVKYYDELVRNGHWVKIYKNKISVTEARNYIVKNLQMEKYLLRLDDDFLFTRQTNIPAMMSIMEKIPDIGALSGIEKQNGDGKGLTSGDYSQGQGYFYISDRILYKIRIPVHNWIWSSIDGVRYSYVDFARNFLLIRTDVFRSVKWNEELIIHGEHTAFMLDLKKSGWALAITPDSVHVHDESFVVQDEKTKLIYKRRRNHQEGRNKMKEVYHKYYGINEMRIFDVNYAEVISHPITKVILNMLLPIVRFLRKLH